jgi:hypothetical protein
MYASAVDALIVSKGGPSRNAAAKSSVEEKQQDTTTAREAAREAKAPDDVLEVTVICVDVSGSMQASPPLTASLVVLALPLTLAPQTPFEADEQVEAGLAKGRTRLEAVKQASSDRPRPSPRLADVLRVP